MPLALVLSAAAPVGPSQADALDRAQSASLASVRNAVQRRLAAEEDSRRLAQARVASLVALRRMEQATADAAGAVEGLVRRQAEAEARLQSRAAQLTPLLPAIERLSLYPAETLLAVPGGTEASLTGLLVLKGIARQLEAEAQALRAEQAEVARLADALRQGEARLVSARSAQAAQAAGLDRQIEDAQARGREAEDEAAVSARRAAEQAGQAQTLRAALSQLDASRREDEARARADATQADRLRQDGAGVEARRRQAALAQPAGPGLALAGSGLADAPGAPVAGSVVRAFGEAADGGPATGISYTAAPGARVSAPCGGRVVFAAPFRSFGRMMIIDCGGGYHFVLSGLDRLDVTVGRPVQPGEPVGAMPAWDPRTTVARPTLYLELRERGQPVNPAPFCDHAPDGDSGTPYVAP